MLLSWLALPIRDIEDAQDVLDFVADLDLGSITDELSWSSMTANVILKSVNKLTLGFHTFRMNPDVLDHDVTRDCKSSKSLFRRSDGLDTFVEHLTSLVQRCCYFTLYPLEPLPGEYVVL